MPFEKGKSGNPGGRPKENEEIKKLAQEHCPAAIKRLAVLMNDPSGRTAVAACTALLDRGHGKPLQAVEHSGSIARTHEEELTDLDNPDTGSDDSTGEGNTSPPP
jgi:hypothetical protein